MGGLKNGLGIEGSVYLLSDKLADQVVIWLLASLLDEIGEVVE
jgi:hypothetical protein